MVFAKRLLRGPKPKRELAHSESDNSLLLAGCRRQEPKAQKELYYQYYSVLMNVCARYQQDKREAEQLLHDSFLKIFKHIDSYAGGGSFEGWMKRICINTCLDHFRKGAGLSSKTEAATQYNLPEETMSEDYVSDGVFEKLALDDLLYLIEELPLKEKTVFKLYVLDGYPHEEISHFLGIKTNHSYWLLHGARKALQTLISKRIS